MIPGDRFPSCEARSGRHLHRPPTPCRGSGATIDLRMRRARPSDFPIIWGATLQTVWDDIPEDERARLDRRRWEPHFRKKIEPYFDRSEKWIAEGPSGEFLGYLLLGESGFLTPGARHVGGRVGAEARSPQDQARSIGDERAGTPCLRGPGISSGAALYGEDPRVVPQGRSPRHEPASKGLNNAPILVQGKGQPC